MKSKRQAVEWEKAEYLAADLRPFLEGIFNTIAPNENSLIENQFANSIVIDSQDDNYRPSFRLVTKTDDTIFLLGPAKRFPSRLVITKIYEDQVSVELIITDRDLKLWSETGDIVFKGKLNFKIGTRKSWSE